MTSPNDNHNIQRSVIEEKEKSCSVPPCMGKWNRGRALSPSGLSLTWQGSELPVTKGSWQRELWTGWLGGHSHLKEGGSLSTGEVHPETLPGGL